MTGQELQSLIRDNNIKVSGFAKKLNVDRRTVYNWFSYDHLSPGIEKSVNTVLSADYSIPAKAPEFTAEYWKNKYISLLEERYAEMRVELGRAS